MEPDVVVREEGSLVSKLTEPADSVVSGTRGHGSGVSGSDSVSEGSKEHDRADTGGILKLLGGMPEVGTQCEVCRGHCGQCGN